MTYVVVFVGSQNRYDHAADLSNTVRAFAEKEHALKYMADIETNNDSMLKRMGYSWANVSMYDLSTNVWTGKVLLNLPVQQRMEVNVKAKKEMEKILKQKVFPDNWFDSPPTPDMWQVLNDTITDTSMTLSTTSTA